MTVIGIMGLSYDSNRYYTWLSYDSNRYYMWLSYDSEILHEAAMIVIGAT